MNAKEVVYRMNPEDFCQAVVRKALTVAAENEPERFMGWFMGGVVTNVLANLPEELWNRLMECRPCGRVGCDCHELAREVMPMLDKLRRDHMQHCPPEARAE